MSTDLVLEPAGGIELCVQQEPPLKSIFAVAPDPQFMVSWVDAGPLRKGWYVLELDFRLKDKKLVGPVLYPDYGQGMSEDTRIPLVFSLKVGSDLRHHTVVNFSHDVVGLRFDPTVGSCQFDLGGCTIRRIGKVEAAGRMLAETLRNSPGRRSKLRLLASAGLDLVTGGVRALGDNIRGGYLRLAVHRETDYDAWVALYGELAGPLPGELDSWPERPLFSIIVPTYNTPARWLRRCIESACAQSYGDWELCISDDASSKDSVRTVIKHYQARDSRIKAVFRKENGHISASSNDALSLASGKYVVLLDHDDELHPHALYKMARAFKENPRWRLAYSDEDKIDEKGRRYDPYFKPDWNYDLFLSHNCISHLGVYERALVSEVGGFRVGYEGSQDWDLALRCIERLDGDQIGHVAHVLYHWRAIPGSTALAPGEKNYAHVAAIKSIQSHLDRIGRDGEVLELLGFAGNYRVRNRLPSPAPRVSLIIPTRDHADLLATAVNSILEKTEYPNYQIVIVDNQSQEQATFDLLDELHADPRVRVIKYDKPFNYSAINNFAVAQVDADIVGLLNNDVEVISPGWLEEMASHAIRPDIGAVGAMLYYPNSTIQHAGVILGFNGVGVHAYADRPRGWLGMMLRGQLLQNYSAVTAACLLIKRDIYLEVGGLDEKLVVAYNDVDFCLRVRAKGYRNLWTPYAELFHHESATRGSDMDSEKRERFDREVALFMERWGDFIKHDPAYNPNLADKGSTFDLSFPPRG